MDATIGFTLVEAVLILLAIAILKAITLISPFDDDSSNNIVDPIPTVPSPSHIDVAPPATKYDVFLSFRGEDTRHTFSSHLYEALCDAKIQTFMDHKLHKGDDISPLLRETIKQSDISLIIFSKDYASSTWCMDELVHVMKCKDQYRRIVIPIFYNVDPSNVRKQNGSFGDGFAKLKQRFNHDQQKVQEWTYALIRSTNLSGWDSKNFRPESKLIKMIVKDILSKLNNKSSSFHLEGLVGIDHRIQKVEGLLSEARIVGIWGMGGTGKTTIARAVFERLKAQFEALSFVGNVRVQLGRIGSDELQEKCLKELLKDDDINTYNLKSSFVRSRLHRKKILLVLDDVDNSIAIEDLIKACDWFGEGSRIIITSRDMQVFKNTSAPTTYHVPELDHHHALHLFSLKAFKQNEPPKSYLELSKWVVDYCEGNPLALIVLGCFLYGRGKEEWESALGKLRQALHKDIYDVLKLSFDGLDDTQKNVFLDLAFILNEAWMISLDCARRIYGSSAHIDISVLKERSLISVHENDYIGMHALLIDMGLQISRQQLISNPEKPIRLWRHEDIYHFFNNDKGAEAIQCLSLDVSKIKRITLTSSHFQKMYNLKFLKLYKSDRKKPSKVQISGDLDSLPEELKFLCWVDCPLQSLPLSLCAENLVHLIMPNSHIQQLWNGNQRFPNLKKIDLRHSKYLMALPDLSEAPNLGSLEVDGCVNLDQIHSSTVLGKLTHLTLESCKRSGHINFVDGPVNGRRNSGLVTVNNFFDLDDFSFTKVTMKLLVSDDGRVITGFKFKLQLLPFEELLECKDYIEIVELILRTQSLAFSLPFVRVVHWSESPIEFGDFKQHFDADNYYDSYFFGERIQIKMKEVGVKERAESVVVWPLIVRGDVGDEHYEEEEEEEEQCCSNNDKSNTLTRVPNDVARWSLLTQVSLQKSDIIGSGGWSIPQVWILRSLAGYDCCEGRLQTLKDIRLCLDVPARDWCSRDFCVSFVHSPEWLRASAMGALSLALFVFGTDIVF